MFGHSLWGFKDLDRTMTQCLGHMPRLNDRRVSVAPAGVGGPCTAMCDFCEILLALSLT